MPNKVCNTVMIPIEEYQELQERSSSHALLMKQAMENIREYNSMIPLHTEDPHANHFVEQIEAWCARALGDEG